MANLTTAIDPSTLGQIKNFTDVNNAAKQNQLVNQAAVLDAQSKANIYKTQVLSAAAGSGNQNVYTTALQHLNDSGIDISDAPQDITQGAAYANAGRLAQSPLGTLYGAQQKVIGNNIAAATAFGSTDNPYTQPVPGITPVTGIPAPQPAAAPAPVQPQAQPTANPAAPTNMGATQPEPPVTINGAIPAPTNMPVPLQRPGETQSAYKLRIENDPAAIASREAAKEMGQGQGTKNVNQSKVQSALTGFVTQSQLVTDNIDKAINLIDNSSFATGYGRMASGGGALPSTDARALDNYLNTIKANVGFDQLQSMRENSPTGGALGQVSDMENKLLQAVKGALDPLSPEQLRANLITIKELYPKVLAQKVTAYKQDYGAEPQLPAAEQKYETGKIYTNKQGQKAIFDGTGFKPVGGK